MPYEWNFRIIWLYKETFVLGTLTTLELTFIAVILGTVFGLFLALGRLSSSSVLKYFSVIYIEIFLALPLLVLLIWTYYSLPLIVKFLTLTSFKTAALCMTLNLAPFVAETIRAGIESIPKGQKEAALSVGMSYSQTMRRIILPQAIRRITPPLLTHYITILKLSSLASVIAVNEIVHSASNLISTTYKPLEIYTTIAVIYLIIILPLTFSTRLLEKKYALRA